MRLRLTLLLALCLALAGSAALAGVPAGITPDDFLESQYALLRETFADRQQVKPGEEFTLALRITPFKNELFEFHTYGAQLTGNADYIASVLLLDPADGVEWSDPVWPEGVNKPSTGGDMFILYGPNVVTIKGKLADSAAPGPRTFTAQAMFSLCTEDMCLPPSQVSLEWNMEVVPADFAGQIAVLTPEELAAPVSVDFSSLTLPEQEDTGGGIDLSDGADGENGAGGFDPGAVKTDAGTKWPLWKVLLFALLGGLVLNIMPCVLPVVSIKVIDLVKHTEKDPKAVINHGFVFAAGIIATFLAGALVIALIQAFGTKLGWGSQFQSPTFLLVMAAVIFVFGLSLADVFKLKAPKAMTDSGGGLAEREGYAGSFFKGVLATVLGTPCVGPFLGPALLVAFTLTWMHTLLIFFFVGLGMALPYIVLLPFVTRMGRRERGQFSRKLQDSKSWMDDFKHGMAFLLFITVVYLLYILNTVSGGLAVIWSLVWLVVIGFATWLYGRMVLSRPGVAGALLAAVVIIAAASLFCLPRVYHAQAAAAAAVGGGTVSAASHEGWEPFSLEALKQYTAEGKTVLVDFTADWCPNCKTNEAVALNVESTLQLKDELGVVFMVADWTKRDDEIGDVLRALGFASVPLTAIFPGANPNQPILLDGLFSPARLQDALREAAGS
jgi:thiol:disulfide interchange protein